jgi:hypothetical protein
MICKFQGESGRIVLFYDTIYFKAPPANLMLFMLHDFENSNKAQAIQ